MKTCCLCKEEKDYSNFYKNKTRKDGYGNECKDCRKKRDRTKYDAKYEKTKRVYVHRYNPRDQSNMRLKKKEYIYSLKSPCVICSEPDPVVIDFHHVDPKTKSFTIGASTHRSREQIFQEVEKCVCLCANCHRRVHAGTVEIPT